MHRREVIGDAELWLGDCREILPTLPRVDAVVTDPPYHGVKADKWDNQWHDDDEFLSWSHSVCAAIARLMSDNASLYWFCSSRMAARIELIIASHLRIINNLVWDKSGTRKGAAGSGVDVSALRGYWTANTERIIFAEKPLGDAEASLIFGVYLRDAFNAAGVGNREIQRLFPSKTGGLTGCVSNWLLGLNVPTQQQYETMAEFLNVASKGSVRFCDYAELKLQYEAIRRPMNLAQAGEWGDVWRFGIEKSPEHPSQKPLELIKHIVSTSSRVQQIILDPFMGSGTTGIACIKLGRRFIGIEIEERYFDIACRRIEQATRQADLFIAPPKPRQLSLADAIEGQE